jgi:hypothetical protein
MRVVDLAGNVSQWKMSGNTVTKDIRPRSKDHVKVRQLLKEVFSTVQVLEEVAIQVAISSCLYLDFYIPLYKIAIEVQGEQHFKFIKHFHRTSYGFILQQKRDQQKAEWCGLNDIQLIYLPYNEDIDAWRNKLSDSD